MLAEVAGLSSVLDITVFADRFENPDPDHVQWARVPLPTGPSFFKDWLFPKIAPLLYRWVVVKCGQFDLVQTTQGQFRGCDISYAHFCHRAYLENHWHNVGVRGVRRLVRWLGHRRNSWREARAFARARVIVVPSKGLAAEVQRTYPATAGKIHCIPNPVSGERFLRSSGYDPNPTRRQMGFAPDDFVMLFVALGDFARKGLRFVIEAMAVPDVGDAKLLVVGGSASEIAYYRRLSARLGLVHDRIYFAGFQADVRPYLWCSNVFVFPSLYETFCLVAYQAALAQLPLIATTVYGVDELLEDDINGWRVDRTVGSVHDAIQKAMAERKRLEQMGRAARSAALQYSPTQFVTRWLALYRGLLPNVDYDRRMQDSTIMK